MSRSNNPHALGTDSLGKLLLQYSIPAIIGMTLVSLYHIIDSIFIGRGVGSDAISGLAVTFPLMNLMASLCTLVGSGGSTIASIRLGQRKVEGATEVLGNTFTLAIINAVICSIPALIFLDDILLFFGASQATLPYAREFMRIILLGTPVMHVMISLNNVMRATGYPLKAMLTSLVSVLFNVILAPVFIFHFKWGMAGAAFATVVSQFIGMVWVVSHFLDRDSFIRLGKDFWRLRLRVMLEIYYTGMPPFLMNVCTCLIVIVINNILKEQSGDLAIGAYGIINRLLTLYAMVVLGLTLGMQPIVGYNYGAMKMERVKETLRLGLITGASITASGFLLFELFPYAISSMFTRDEALIQIAATGLRISAAMFATVGIQIVISNFFQGIGKARISIFLTLCRQLVYLLPCLLILPQYWGVKGVWASMSISDGLAFFTAVVAMILFFRKQKKAGSVM